MYWLEDEHFDLAKEHILSLRYRVVVHAGDEKSAGIQELFEQYKKTARRTSAQKAQMEFLQRHVISRLHNMR
jgi:hypothetical protein